MTTFSPAWGSPPESALSTMLFRSTCLPFRQVKSPAKTALDPDMRMRSPSAPEPNPANTTEWMAPMRTVASMRMIASGIVGM